MLDNENRNCNCNCNCGSMMNNNSNMMVENNDYPNTITAPAGFGMNSNNCFPSNPGTNPFFVWIDAIVPPVVINNIFFII